VIAIQQAMAYVRAIRDNEEGQGLVEYGLILGLVSILAVAALGVLSGDVNGILEEVGGAL
jgi:pilus assembly protein Flp/PilA